jgi:hypothetical protein
VEEVLDDDGVAVTVTASGHGGACFGDSGGPLLVRDESGAIRVVGLLTRGSSNCLGSDEYVRLSAAAAWLQPALPPGPLSPATCGSLTSVGRCYGSIALWCHSGDLQHDACASQGQGCGWSTQDSGYRCVKDDTDPCLSKNEFGECSDGIAVRCHEGELVQERCDQCSTCARNPLNGWASCTVPKAASPIQPDPEP